MRLGSPSRRRPHPRPTPHFPSGTVIGIGSRDVFIRQDVILRTGEDIHVLKLPQWRTPARFAWAVGILLALRKRLLKI